MKTIPLRRRLLVLVAAGVIPLATMSVVSLYVLMRQQRTQAERAGAEITRALSTAVDFELRRSISLLETLGTSTALDVADYTAFRARASRMLRIRPEWGAIILADADLNVVLEVPGETRLASGEIETLREALLERRPSVGNLAKGADGSFRALVAVPITGNDAAHHALAAALKPGTFLELLRRQLLPEDWVVSIFDARGNRVARSRAHEEHLGTPASPSLAELMATGSETGTGITHALEGDRIYTAYTRLEASGWSVAIGLPTSLVEAGARRSIALLGGGVLLSLALGIAAALSVARRIAEPISELRDAANAFGQREPVAVPVTSIEEIAQVARALVAAHEERARNEREREDLLAREREARAAAEAASRAKDQFLAMLGHELRNPLGAIANASQVLEHPSADAAMTSRARQVIRRQIEHLTHLVDDLLDAGRAVLGKILLHRQPVELAGETERAISTLENAGRFERHVLRRDLSPVWVEADATRLEQIVVNLLTNAIRYTPPGRAIDVSVRREGGEAVLRIADEGIGMPPDLAARAFELFVQGDRELDRTHGGLGVGLTLVRRLVELQDGRATGESPGPGQGSTFTVRLPAIAKPAVKAADAAAPETVPARDILIVEDNDDAREMLRELLEFAGHRVRVAASGTKGLETALADPPEVALVDVGLPGIDGYELARRLRAAQDGKRPFLVALTGYGLPEDRERALAAGFDAHLVKPVDDAALRHLLAKAAGGGSEDSSAPLR